MKKKINVYPMLLRYMGEEERNKQKNKENKKFDKYNK